MASIIAKLPDDNVKHNDKDTGYSVTRPRLEAIARILLMGVYDDNNILSHLRGVRYILKAIWEMALEFNSHYFNDYIELSTSTSHQYYNFGSKNKKFMKEYWSPIKFPPKQDLNINMMPFVMSTGFSDSGLPSYLKGWYPIIKTCLQTDRSQLNKIGYLTVQESLVEKGKTQRRPGLHVETPGDIYIHQQICNESGNGDEESIEKEYVKGGGWNDQQPVYSWGGSINYYRNKPREGIFMASNMENSTRVWDCRINKKDGREVIGHLGDIEHLRKYLPTTEDKEKILTPNRICWLTDRTPHEVLPAEETGYRQYFRLVTSNVSIWYQQHSTANPTGIVPDATKTTIITKTKFDKPQQNDQDE